MFDIGFSEVLVIFVLALVVLGPEKLPRVAAQVGRWIGRARGMARQFREQLEEEVNLEEARKAQPVARTPPAPPPPPVPLPPPTAEVPATGVPPAEAEVPTPPMPPAEPEHQIVYPDTYSHAHPTDSLGRPVAAPTTEPPAAEPGQQEDWVGEVTQTDKPAQTTADAAYAPPHERGT
jgi:sec-independent protein translocase protein TatB